MILATLLFEIQKSKLLKHVIHLLHCRTEQVAVTFRRVRLDFVGRAGTLFQQASHMIAIFAVNGIPAFNIALTSAEHGNLNLPGQDPQEF